MGRHHPARLPGWRDERWMRFDRARVVLVTYDNGALVIR
jgi:hypothetical protein